MTLLPFKLSALSTPLLPVQYFSYEQSQTGVFTVKERNTAFTIEIGEEQCKATLAAVGTTLVLTFFTCHAGGRTVKLEFIFWL